MTLLNIKICGIAFATLIPDSSKEPKTFARHESPRSQANVYPTTGVYIKFANCQANFLKFDLNFIKTGVNTLYEQEGSILASPAVYFA